MSDAIFPFSDICSRNTLAEHYNTIVTKINATTDVNTRRLLILMSDSVKNRISEFEQFCKLDIPYLMTLTITLPELGLVDKKVSDLIATLDIIEGG